MLNSNISSICPYNMANFGPLTAEIGSGVWGTPANFNGFRAFVTAATYVAHRRPTKLCTMFGRLLRWYTVYSFSEALASWRNFTTCKIHFASKSCLLLYWQRYCTALQQRASAKSCGGLQGMELRNFRRGRHLYSAERWASAHIQVQILTNEQNMLNILIAFQTR